jgi:hypothetical protein
MRKIREQRIALRLKTLKNKIHTFYERKSEMDLSSSVRPWIKIVMLLCVVLPLGYKFTYELGSMLGSLSVTLSMVIFFSFFVVALKLLKIF